MNKRNLLFMFLFVILLAIPVFSESFPDNTNYEYYIPTYDAGIVSGAATYRQVQQSFRIGDAGTNATFNLSGFQLPIYDEVGSCGAGDKFSITLFATNASGYFQGDALSENLTVACNILPTSSGNYLNITMPIYELDAGTQYAIVMWNYESDADFSLYWQAEAVGAYGGGHAGGNSSGSYVSQDYDLGFEVWGNTTEEIISVTLVSPADNEAIADIGANFSINVSSTANLDNVTYFVWNTTIEIFNQTTVNITGTTNDTTLYINNFTLGTYTWNAWGCDFSNNCIFGTSNFTLTVGATIDTTNYSNITYETSYETFQTNLTLLEGANLHVADLYYNQTAYRGTVTSLGNDKYFLERKIDVLTKNPALADENYTFFWRLTYEKDDGSFIYENLTSYNQTIHNMTLGNCSNGLSYTTLNFTAWNEEVITTRINDYDFAGTFYYWLGTGTQMKNVSFNNPSIDEQDICINLGNSTYYMNGTLQYERIGYDKRSYYFTNASLTNVTNEIELFFLNTSTSTSFIINIIDNVQLPVSNAYIYIQRYYPGSGEFHTVEMAITDDSGNAVGQFEADTEDYRIIVILDGVIVYTSGTQKVYCAETPCTLTFQIEAAAPTAWRDIGDINNLVYTFDYNETTNIWTYTYVDTSGTTNYGRLFVYLRDGAGETIICNSSDVSSAATLTCNVTGYDGTIYAEAYISRSPEILVFIKSIIEKTIKGIFGMEGLFWAAIILLVIGLVGLWNPSIGIIMLVAGVILINFLQIASLGSVTIMGIAIIGGILLWEFRKEF